jgi:hypothetical protein
VLGCVSLAAAQEHYATLSQARTKPPVLDDATLSRRDLEWIEVYQRQLDRWQTVPLTAQQHRITAVPAAHAKNGSKPTAQNHEPSKRPREGLILATSRWCASDDHVARQCVSDEDASLLHTGRRGAPANPRRQKRHVPLELDAARRSPGVEISTRHVVHADNWVQGDAGVGRSA